MEIASKAVVALDHGGEKGVWTRRAKKGGRLRDSDGYGMLLMLPKRRGPYDKVGYENLREQN